MKNIYELIKEMTKEEMAEMLVDIGFDNEFAYSISRVKCHKDRCEYYDDCNENNNSVPCKYTNEEMVLAFLEFSQKSIL